LESRPPKAIQEELEAVCVDPVHSNDVVDASGSDGLEDVRSGHGVRITYGDAVVDSAGDTGEGAERFGCATVASEIKDDVRLERVIFDGCGVRSRRSEQSRGNGAEHEVSDCVHGKYFVIASAKRVELAQGRMAEQGTNATGTALPFHNGRDPSRPEAWRQGISAMVREGERAHPGDVVGLEG